MKTDYIIWYAIALHLITGFSLLIHGGELRTAALSPFYDYLPSQGVGVALVSIALLSLYAIAKLNTKMSTMFLVPQQLLILMSGVIAFNLSTQGEYADGVQRPFFFIFTDQLPVMLLAVFYTMSIIRSLRKQWQSNL